MKVPSPVVLRGRCSNGRWPQDEAKVKFVEILPLRLRNYVSGKGGEKSDVACLQEMSILFACLKVNEFDQNKCSKEVKNFNGCYKTYMDTEFAKKEEQKKGTVATGKKLHALQLNQYLRKYPAP